MTKNYPITAGLLLDLLNEATDIESFRSALLQRLDDKPVSINPLFDPWSCYKSLHGSDKIT